MCRAARTTAAILGGVLMLHRRRLSVPPQVTRTSFCSERSS
jgi:hypothetical protein